MHHIQPPNRKTKLNNNTSTNIYTSTVVEYYAFIKCNIINKTFYIKV